MQNPINLQVAVLDGVTLGAANVTTDTTILVAPGLGRRRRLWQASVAISRNDAAAGFSVELRFLDPSTTVVTELRRLNEYVDAVVFEWPGGLRWGENELVRLRTIANAAAATRTVRAGVYFTTEEI